MPPPCAATSWARGPSHEALRPARHPARAALAEARYAAVSRWFAVLGLAALLAADLHVTSLHPWSDLERLLGGLVRPDFLAVEGSSVLYTVAFAVLGVGLGAGAGFLLAIPYARFRAVRIACAFLRAVHELFWALLLMQVFGLSATTGILAIALPYAGICAKVYAEIIEEADLSALRVLPAGTDAVSAFAYARLPEVLASIRAYTFYRLECGMRSTLVLGFIGLPTMGFYLESAFRQGRYGEAGALMLVFYALIGTRRLWVRGWTLPLLVLARSSSCRPWWAARMSARASRGSSGTTSFPLPCAMRRCWRPTPGPRPGRLSGRGSGRSSPARSCPERCRPWCSPRSRWWPPRSGRSCSSR